MKMFSIVVATLISIPAFGQITFKQNTVYAEIGGNALLASINYERQIFKTPGLGLHAGLGLYGLSDTYLTIPLGVNYLLKLNELTYLDIGFGGTYSKAEVDLYAVVKENSPKTPNTDFWNVIPSIGLRKQTLGNLMYRFTFAPVINQRNEFLPFFGFAIGKNF